jgi:hypothetical protein
METVARDENCLFRRFYPFLAFEIIRNNVWLHVDTRKDYEVYMGKNGVYGDNVKIILLVKFMKCLSLSLSVQNHITTECYSWSNCG